MCWTQTRIGESAPLSSGEPVRIGGRRRESSERRLYMSLQVRTAFPRRVRVIRHAWIPTSDGGRLAARIWLPEDAEDHPVPAIMEYIPYRKNDALALRDAPIHAYFAGYGYASIRVDLRGSGDSDGIMRDEYLPQEQDDGIDAMRWMAAQPWCTGKVGIIGKSWGGFNGLQIAGPRSAGARRRDQRGLDR